MRWPLENLFRSLGQSPAPKSEIDNESRSQIKHPAKGNIDAGGRPDEVGQKVSKRLGNFPFLREICRGVHRVTFGETFFQDLRYGARQLMRNPGFAAAAILTLALGIGANTAIFSVVRGVLLKPLAYSDPDRIVVMLMEGRNPVSPADFLDWRAQSRSFSGMAAAEMWNGNLTGGERPESVPGLRIGEGMFELLGVPPLIGRTFQSDDFVAGKDRVVVLGHRLWQRQFGGDSNVVGRSFALNGESYQVVGVMPPSFQFAPFWATRTEMWAPLELASRAPERDSHSLRVFARLKPGVARAQAQAEMDTIWTRLAQAYPDSDSGRTLKVDALMDKVVGDVRPALLVLGGAVAFVLLIACANVANLLLVRGASRQKEMAVRAALGAGRWRMARQLLAESLLLSTAGAGLGLALSFCGIGLLRAMLEPHSGADRLRMPRLAEITWDTPTVVFALATGLLTGLVFGLAPALQAAVPESFGDMKRAGRGMTDGREGRRLRGALVVVEIAMALVTLAGAGLMLHSFARLETLDSGFAAGKVLSFTVSLQGQPGMVAAKREVFYEQLLREIAAMPGVRSASAINHLPLAGDLWDRWLHVEGRPVVKPSDGFGATYRVCRPGYFETMGIPLLRGRSFTDMDRSDAPGVVMINERLARDQWPGEDPVGRQVTFDDGGASSKWFTVVGVIKNVKQGDWSAADANEIYLPFQQSPFLTDPAGHFSAMTLVIRTSTDPMALLNPARNAVWSLNRGAPVSNVTTLERVLSDAVSRPRFNLILISLFAGLALVLAAIGIYGVMAYTVAQRAQEMGIRMALGAERRDVLGLVLGRGMKLALAGAALGLAGGLALTRLMSSLLYEVTPGDPLSFAGAAALLGLVTLFACWLPARRAANTDPIVALRAE